MQTRTLRTWANFLWLAILCVVGVGGSLVISCVAPFVALAVALAGTVRISLALRVMSVIWFTNQLIGFCFFHFPRTANTFLWGFTIGGAALLSTWVASLAINRARPSSMIARLAGARRGICRLRRDARRGRIGSGRGGGIRAGDRRATCSRERGLVCRTHRLERTNIDLRQIVDRRNAATRESVMIQ
jgi:hypothetical protein